MVDGELELASPLDSVDTGEGLGGMLLVPSDAAELEPFWLGVAVQLVTASPRAVIASSTNFLLLGRHPVVEAMRTPKIALPMATIPAIPVPSNACSGCMLVILGGCTRR